jgi:hypothetical protein
MRASSILILLILLLGCGKEENNPGNFDLNNTFVLAAGQFMHDDDHNIGIYLDSVLYDSRCPLGFLCAWEGNAHVRFKFVSDHKSTDLYLNTFKDFQTDTIVNGYKISMLSLAPHPKSGVKTEQKEYRATMLISR